MLRLGEYLGGSFANEVIVISRVIGDIVRKRCNRDSNLIYNGVPLPNKSLNTDFVERIGARPKQYVLAVARFVPEKGLHDLIAAFLGLDNNHKLVIAGDADHETAYTSSLRNLAAQDDRIILAGYITGETLNQIFSHARLFILPSYHEGLPIALLEAMSYGLPVLVSDIPANKEVNLQNERYFKCGDVEDLKEKMESLIENGLSESERDELLIRIVEDYNWQKIADQTVNVYKKVLKG